MSAVEKPSHLELLRNDSTANRPELVKHDPSANAPERDTALDAPEVVENGGPQQGTPHDVGLQVAADRSPPIRAESPQRESIIFAIIVLALKLAFSVRVVYVGLNGLTYYLSVWTIILVGIQLAWPNYLVVLVSVFWPIPFRRSELACRILSMLADGVNVALWFALFCLELVYLANFPQYQSPPTKALASMIIISW